MNVLNKFLDAIRLNDNYDEDDEYFDNDEEEIDETTKPKKCFFKKKADDDLKNDEEDGAKKKSSHTSSISFKKEQHPNLSIPSKVRPMHKRVVNSEMEVCVIKPSSMEDTREITDTLLTQCTIVLNLEVVDLEVAQRIIDFSSGACYSTNGGLQKVSSYIFILTPVSVKISGDIQDMLNSTITNRSEQSFDMK